MKLTFSIALAAASLAAGLVLYPAAHLRAQRTPIFSSTPPYVTFGMVSMTYSQSARLNALLLPMGGPVVAGSCQVTFAFLNDQGGTIASATMPITQNQAVHFNFPPLPVPIGGNTSNEIRGTVQTAFVSPSGSPLPGPSCAVVPTMEIYDLTTGQTTLLLENTHTLPEVLPLTAM